MRHPQATENAPAASMLLYSIREAVKVTGLSRSALYKLIADGELRTLHFGRAVRITAKSLRKLIARRAEPARERKAQSAIRALLERALAANAKRRLTKRKVADARDSPHP